jgi:hypothetical protein
MASLNITNTLVSGARIIASQLNTNFGDISTYINNHNSASSSWDALSVGGASSLSGAITAYSTLAVTGATTLSSTLSVAGSSALTDDLVLTGSAASTITLKAALTKVPSVFFKINNTTKAIVGVAGTTDDIITGSVANDLCIRSEGGNLLLCTDSGASAKVSITSAGVATFSGQLIGKGTATNDDAATGYIGEALISSVSTFASAGTSAQFKDITTITLPSAGDWEVIGTVMVKRNGSNGTDPRMAVSIDADNTQSDHVVGYNELYLADASGFTASPGTVVYRVSTTGAQVMHLKALWIHTSGTPQMLGTIRARRVR